MGPRHIAGENRIVLDPARGEERRRLLIIDRADQRGQPRTRDIGFLVIDVLGGARGGIDKAADLLSKPVFHAARQDQSEEHGRENRRRGRGQGKQAHKAQVQARCRFAETPAPHPPAQADEDHRSEGEQKQAIADEDGQGQPITGLQHCAIAKNRNRGQHHHGQ